MIQIPHVPDHPNIGLIYYKITHATLYFYFLCRLVTIVALYLPDIKPICMCSVSCVIVVDTLVEILPINATTIYNVTIQYSNYSVVSFPHYSSSTVVQQ